MESVKADNFRPMGRTGLNRYGGIVYEEYLTELSGLRWHRIVREMLDEGVIAGASLVIELLMRQAEWTIQAASEDAEDIAAADFVTESLHDMEDTLQDMLSEAVSFLWYGFSILEITYKRRNGDMQRGRRSTNRPQYKSKYSDGRIGWASWGLRAQPTITEWGFNDWGGVDYVEQQAAPDWRIVQIPMSKCLHFRPKIHKGNPEGRSILRGAYRNWYFKRRLENIEAVSAERDGTGVPVAYVPPEILRSDATPEEQSILQAVREFVRNIRIDEHEGIVAPVAYDEKGNQMYRLELLASPGTKALDIDKMIRRHRQEMLIAILSEFILLGLERVGTQSLGNTKSEMFSTALNAFMDSIAATINKQAIPQLLKLNGMMGKCMLTHSEPEQVNLSDLAQFITAIAKVGVDLSSDEVQARLLNLADLPIKEANKE